MPIPRLPSIRQRVTRSLLGISLLWCALIASVVWYVVRHEVDEVMDHGLRESAEIFRSLLATLPPGHQGGEALPRETDEELRLVWQVIDSGSGAVVLRSHKAPEMALAARLSSEIFSSPEGQWRVITLGFGQDASRFLLVAQSEEERGDARDEVVLYTLIHALWASLLATVLLNVLLRRELRPLAALSHAVQRYDPLVPASAPMGTARAELEPIERSVRDLGQRLAQRVITERAFTAHAAHALRTPLAGIDAQLAMAHKEAPPELRPRLERTRQAATRLSHVMQALLGMFRSGVEPQRRVFTLADILAPLSFGELQLSLSDDGPLHADPDLLAAVLMNLLDNAQRHQARNVRLLVEHAQGWIHLRVEDDGAGCSPAQRDALRQALERQDYSSDNGLKGLGLILADLVMRAHGGRLQLPAAAQGFAVELAWPDKRPSASGH